MRSRCVKKKKKNEKDNNSSFMYWMSTYLFSPSPSVFVHASAGIFVADKCFLWDGNVSDLRTALGIGGRLRPERWAGVHVGCRQALWRAEQRPGLFSTVRVTIFVYFELWVSSPSDDDVWILRLVLEHCASPLATRPTHRRTCCSARTICKRCFLCSRPTPVEHFKDFQYVNVFCVLSGHEH